MINFFRKIRKQLADDNKPLKYMRYAIGEIVLVVIGILIALSINNWNEERKEKILKDTYTEQLANSLKKDIIRLEEYVELNNLIDVESFYLLDYLLYRVEEPDFFRLTRATMLAADLRTPSSNTSVYNDLISTGNLKLYKNPVFKDLLNDYFNDNRQNLDEHLRDELRERYIQEVIKHVDPLSWREIRLELKAPKFEGFVELNQFQVDWGKMQKNEELILRLKKGIASRSNANMGVKEFLEKARSLNDYIGNNNDSL